MNEERNPLNNEKKKAVVGIAVGFVAMVALIGAFTLTSYDSGIKSELAKEEGDRETEELVLEKANTDDILNEEPVEEAEPIVEEVVPEVVAPEVEVETEVALEGNEVAPEVYFEDAGVLKWPVLGGVIMNYNMDSTIYFETLDQYKTNPAMVIDGQVDEVVKSASRGIVQSVDQVVELGTVVTVDMGNKFQAVYAQVKDVVVEPGELIEAGDSIAVIAEPKSYYQIEGPNLYFQILKDGQTVNPLDYLE